ncbi:MAG: efflux RND transporter periplasmic adaptor subunit [Planctomycetota bacterium]
METPTGTNLSRPFTRRRWRPHIVVPTIVVVIIGSLLFVTARETLRPTIPVSVSPAVLPADNTSVAREPGRPRVQTVQAPGWLEADPYFIACTALADGVMEEILVLEGEAVEKGQVVAKMVRDDAQLALAVAEAELAAAEAVVGIEKAHYAASELDWEHPIERDRALETSRATLAETEAELAQLPALIDVEEATVERLREETERARRAVSSGAINELELIILEKRVEAQAARLEALRKRDAILRARRDRLQANVRAAERNAELRIEERRNLTTELAKIQQVEAEAMLARVRRDEAQLRLDRMVIRAPITGVVQRRLKVPGDKVMLGMDDPHSAHVLHLFDPAHLQVRVDVPLADASHISVGQACEVVVEVLPDTTFRGEVTRITNEADLQKNTLQIKVRVLDPSTVLKPEMLTRVKFLGTIGAATSTSTDTSSVLVPTDALTQRTDDAGIVWTVRSRRGAVGTAQPVSVSVLSTEQGSTLVRGPLTQGDLLVVSNTELRPGQRVRMLAAGGVQ